MGVVATSRGQGFFNAQGVNTSGNIRRQTAVIYDVLSEGPIEGLVDGVAKALPCSLDVDNCIIQVVDNAQGIEVEVTRDSANSQILVKALGGSLTDVKVLVWEVSCDEVVIP